MNLIKKIIGFFKCKKKPICPNGNKDISDYREDGLSTGWHPDDRHCEKCKKSTSHNEYMSDICNSCGGFNTQVRFGRAYRKVYIDGVWKYHVKYKSGHEEVINKWY